VEHFREPKFGFNLAGLGGVDVGEASPECACPPVLFLKEGGEYRQGE